MRLLQSFPSCFSLLLFLFLSLPPQLYATENVGKVVLIKGHATKLLPHTMEATEVKLGDLLPEDTSLVTDDKSIVRVQFRDNSMVNLGPNGKLLINQLGANRPGILTLLSGHIRVKVEKDKGGAKEGDSDSPSGGNKLFIKTRSAAMGIRGTKFQTVYNPANKMTSLLTFEGEVAMAKLDGFEGKKGEENPASKDLAKASASEEVKAIKEDKLVSLLASKDSVVVKEGRFSGAIDNLEKATIPVKISPVQFKAMAKNANNELSPKGERESGKGKEEEAKLGKDLDTEGKAASDQEDPNPEGYFDSKSGEMAPKAGGYIDTTTGLYVPPPKGSEFDSINNVFIPPQNAGEIDSKDGQYVPPPGLKIDPAKGFVLDEEIKGGDAKKVAQLRNLQQSLNNETLPAVAAKIEAEKAVESNGGANPQDELAKEKGEAGSRRPITAGLGYKMVTQKMNVDGKAGQGQREFKSDSGFEIELSALYGFKEKFRGMVSLMLGALAYPDSKDVPFKQENKGLKSLNLALENALLDNLWFRYGIGFEDDLIIDNIKNVNVIRVNTAKAKLLLKYIFLRRESFSLSANAGLVFLGANDKGGVSTIESVGSNLALEASVPFDKNFAMNLSLWHKDEKVKTANNNINRESNGFGINYLLGF